MLVKTERFGDLHIDEERIVQFPAGILGFEELKRYVLVERSTHASICFLQAVDDPDVAFALGEPASFRPDYRPQLWDDDREALAYTGQETLQVWAILTVPQDVRQITANLLAPVVINVERRLGRQVVQSDGVYSTRHNILEELARAQRLVVPASPDAHAGVAEQEHRESALRKTV